ncbi:MAG: phosphonopyruvate decarboxylase, partial [Myxococcota bacterium]|nr:phosphonopyruvate decarboxylase [Myxococcota bacterium]
DSLLKDFCAYVSDHAPADRHVITSNEGSAIALAAGHHLGTGELSVVYLQNSGLGNTVNPLTSLADPMVYGVPMLLVIGWRGQPGRHDEPQHIKMGGVTEGLLGAIDVPFAVLPASTEEASAVVRHAIDTARAQASPFALVVPKDTFAPHALESATDNSYPLTREAAIDAFVEGLPGDALIVSTTGKPSRELFEIREARGQGHDQDFLTVGSMGHASQIALGVAMARPERPVYCLDGDGAALMHLGGLATIGTIAPTNYRHLIVNNGAHDSVGGQPTVGFDVDLCAVAEACGYRNLGSVSSPDELQDAYARFHATSGPVLLEVRVQRGARKDLGRPTMTPGQLKERFMAASGAGASPGTGPIQ